MVFFVEGDKATTNAQLNGTGTTQGNWVTGTPYPIFNPVDPQCSQFNKDYNIQFFPTIYMICPDKIVYEIGQATEAQIVSKMFNTCTLFSYDATTTATPSSTVCNTNFSPIVTLRNGGSTNLTSCKLTYKIDNGASLTYNWTGNLIPKATADVTLPTVTTTLGAHTLNVVTSLPSGNTDQYTANDSKTYDFIVNSTTGLSLPYSEGFAGNFPVSGWLINNPDGATTWAKNTSVGGSGASTSCVFYGAYDYAETKEIDEFQLNPLNFTSIASPTLEFNVAYAPYNATYYEKLEVLVSTDCAATWTVVYDKANTTLGTVPPKTAKFVPAASEWRKETIDLKNYIGKPAVYVKFKVTNGNGNELYIDDINIKGTSTVGLEGNIINNSLNIFPVPAHDVLNISYRNDHTENILFNLYNSIGELVSSKSIISINGQQQLSFETNNLPQGLYVLEVKAGVFSTTQKITIH